MLSNVLKYSENNMWVRFKGERAVIGITEYLLEDIEDITLVSLPKTREEISQDDIFGSLETSEEVIDLVAPISGEVVRVNSLVKEDPSVLIEDPYGDGWLIEVEVYDEDEIENLLDAEEYEGKIG